MQYPTTKELNEMTFQVGLVGTDGIVLASDTFRQTFDAPERSTGNVSKLLPGDGVVCCYSGDLVAEAAANIIQGISWRDISPDRESIREELKIAGSRAWVENQEIAAAYPGVSRKVIVAVHDMLFWLDITWSSPVTNQALDRFVAGDAENTARHFTNKYANDCQFLPVSQLVTLAAYTVLVAGQENPHGVRGVEVIVIPAGGAARRLTPEQIEVLTMRALRLDSIIKERLLEPFDYA